MRSNYHSGCKYPCPIRQNENMVLELSKGFCIDFLLRTSLRNNMKQIDEMEVFHKLFVTTLSYPCVPL